MRIVKRESKKIPVLVKLYPFCTWFISLIGKCFKKQKTTQNSCTFYKGFPKSEEE